MKALSKNRILMILFAGAALPSGAVQAAHNQTALDRSLLAAALRGETNTVRYLLSQGADVKARDQTGDTALAWAASSGSLATVSALQVRGADVNARNEYGIGPLSRAASVNQIAIVTALLRWGADPNLKDKDGQTVLMAIATAGQFLLVAPLVRGGADVNARDHAGRTPLIHAAMREINRHPDFNTIRVRRQRTAETVAPVTALRKAGADISVKDKGGLTALNWAVRMKNTALLTSLSGKIARLQERTEKEQTQWVSSKSARSKSFRKSRFLSVLRKSPKSAASPSLMRWTGIVSRTIWRG